MEQKVELTQREVLDKLTYEGKREVAESCCATCEGGAYVFDSDCCYWCEAFKQEALVWLAHA